MSGSGSHEALALSAGIERLKEPLGLQVCELPKFGRVGPVYIGSPSYIGALVSRAGS